MTINNTTMKLKKKNNMKMMIVLQETKHTLYKESR